MPHIEVCAPVFEAKVKRIKYVIRRCESLRALAGVGGLRVRVEALDLQPMRLPAIELQHQSVVLGCDTVGNCCDPAKQGIRPQLSHGGRRCGGHVKEWHCNGVPGIRCSCGKGVGDGVRWRKSRHGRDPESPNQRVVGSRIERVEILGGRPVHVHRSCLGYWHACLGYWHGCLGGRFRHEPMLRVLLAMPGVLMGMPGVVADSDTQRMPRELACMPRRLVSSGAGRMPQVLARMPRRRAMGRDRAAYPAVPDLPHHRRAQG
jgi:hypothetical protein